MINVVAMEPIHPLYRVEAKTCKRFREKKTEKGVIVTHTKTPKKKDRYTRGKENYTQSPGEDAPSRQGEEALGEMRLNNSFP